MISRSSGGGLVFLLGDAAMQALVGSDRRPRKPWVQSLSQTGFTGHFIVVGPMGG
ncbi:hypothetical protein Hanom_Chr15g01381501 [Helianthus anomalus]